jgi:H+-transporting ATPase
MAEEARLMAHPHPFPANEQGSVDLGKAGLDVVKSRLGFSAEGLSQSEAQARVGQFGFNELPEEKVNPLLKFLSYFWGPIPWMIEVAAVLSAVVRRWEDLGIILALLLMNAGVGFWEEFQAGNAIAALKATLALQARVRRDGIWKTVPVCWRAIRSR